MMRMYKQLLATAGIALWVLGCKAPLPKTHFAKNDIQFFCNEQLTNTIVFDIISPPVASRMYAYSHLAFYEALRPMQADAASVTDSLHGFAPMPAPEAGNAYDFRLAAGTAFCEVAAALVFSKDSIVAAQKQIAETFADLEESVQERSILFGKAIAEKIIERSKTDGYKQTRGMPRFSVFQDTTMWQQTPPDYADALEPNWALIKAFRLDSANQCSPPPPPAFSLDKNSWFYKELTEVYEVCTNRTPLQDTIAVYWDDNPFVTEHTGHLTYANKKTTPVGHWMGITGILCGQYAKDDLLKTAKAYALTSSAIFDAFISCWHEKYRSLQIRPITVIRATVDPLWNSRLQTPAFPEYTSGHSVTSAAGALVLENMFGAVPFHDTTELKYLGLERSFSSPMAAATEAGMSRMYGGIHYRSAIDEGQRQGVAVGRLFLPLLK